MLNIFKDARSLLGTFVLVILLFIFVLLSGNFTFLRKDACYPLNAVFENVSGLSIGSDVVVSGIRVGEVTGISLQDSFRVEVRMCIREGVHFPEDSVALISAKNILSNSRYVKIDLGYEEQRLPPGGSFEFTRSILDVEALLRLLVPRILTK